MGDEAFSIVVCPVFCVVFHLRDHLSYGALLATDFCIGICHSVLIQPDQRMNVQDRCDMGSSAADPPAMVQKGEIGCKKLVMDTGTMLHDPVGSCCQ